MGSPQGEDSCFPFCTQHLNGASPIKNPERIALLGPGFTAMLEISRREILKCRELLAAHEIHVPADQELVPIMGIPAE